MMMIMMISSIFQLGFGIPVERDSTQPGQEVRGDLTPDRTRLAGQLAHVRLQKGTPCNPRGAVCQSGGGESMCALVLPVGRQLSVSWAPVERAHREQTMPQSKTPTPRSTECRS
eukprot:COSAG01_NODE_46191_length_402_cov_0.887789_1_plen_114_part_10